jgi:hypothetical protein
MVRARREYRSITATAIADIASLRRLEDATRPDVGRIAAAAARAARAVRACVPAIRGGNWPADARYDAHVLARGLVADAAFLSRAAKVKNARQLIAVEVSVSGLVPDPNGADAALRDDLGLPKKPNGVW